MHHPVYSTAKNRDNTILRERFKPIFEKYGVDLVLQGHDHTYARGGLGKKRPVYLLSVAGPKMYESILNAGWKLQRHRRNCIR